MGEFFEQEHAHPIVAAAIRQLHAKKHRPINQAEIREALVNERTPHAAWLMDEAFARSRAIAKYKGRSRATISAMVAEYVVSWFSQQWTVHLRAGTKSEWMNEFERKPPEGENYSYWPIEGDFLTSGEQARSGTFLEGASKKILVDRFERSSKARSDCLRVHGYLCSVCGFDFAVVYGPTGHEYIHVHHSVPMSKIGKEYAVDPAKDLVPICPNCHAMIHRSSTPLTIARLRELMAIARRANEKRCKGPEHR
jgi:hypothetical protein